MFVRFKFHKSSHRSSLVVVLACIRRKLIARLILAIKEQRGGVIWIFSSFTILVSVGKAVAHSRIQIVSELNSHIWEASKVCQSTHSSAMFCWRPSQVSIEARIWAQHLGWRTLLVHSSDYVAETTHLVLWILAIKLIWCILVLFFQWTNILWRIVRTSVLIFLHGMLRKLIRFFPGKRLESLSLWIRIILIQSLNLIVGISSHHIALLGKLLDRLLLRNLLLHCSCSVAVFKRVGCWMFSAAEAALAIAAGATGVVAAKEGARGGEVGHCSSLGSWVKLLRLWLWSWSFVLCSNNFVLVLLIVVLLPIHLIILILDFHLIHDIWLLLERFRTNTSHCAALLICELLILLLVRRWQMRCLHVGRRGDTWLLLKWLEGWRCLPGLLLLIMSSSSWWPLHVVNQRLASIAQCLCIWKVLVVFELLVDWVCRWRQRLGLSIMAFLWLLDPLEHVWFLNLLSLLLLRLLLVKGFNLLFEVVALEI